MPDKKLTIECFKTGEITDSGGNTHTWTLEELNTIAAKYMEAIKTDPSAEAPVVKGHPETDDPAYGWVKGLHVEGNILNADISIVPAFADEVKEEMYKKVSIALREDLSLRHIGFLGAVPPAVKGLEPVKFAGDDKFKIYTYAVGDPATAGTNEDFSKNYSNFSMSLKEELKRNKPSVYADYNDGDFADPIHFRFPIKTFANTTASMAIFKTARVQKQYDEAERQYIVSRLFRAAMNHGINVNSNNWKLEYVELPAEQLTKKQLIDYVNQNTANPNKFISPTGGTMEEWLNAFITAMTQKLSEVGSEEVATQFQAAAMEYKTTNPPPAAPAAANEQQTTASEPQIPKEFAEKLKAFEIRTKELEQKNRQMEFNSYIENQMKAGKIVPAQKTLIFNSLEYLNGYTGALEFAEGGKNIKLDGGVNVLKSVIESFPESVKFGEFAKDGKAPENTAGNTPLPPGMVFNEDDTFSKDLVQKTKQFMEEQKKAGKEISFEQALLSVTSSM